MSPSAASVEVTLTIPDAAAKWMAARDKGISSECIWWRMVGAPKCGEPAARAFGNHPHDPSDLGRCIRLLEVVPEWAPRIAEMRAESPAWAALVDHWDELVGLYREELASGMARRCYDRMKELLKDLESSKVIRVAL